MTTELKPFDFMVHYLKSTWIGRGVILFDIILVALSVYSFAAGDVFFGFLYIVAFIVANVLFACWMYIAYFYVMLMLIVLTRVLMGFFGVQS